MSARLLQLLDRRGRVTVVPCQNREARESLGIKQEQCSRAAWAVDSDGRAYRGAGAMNAALACALASPVPLWVYGLPLMGWIEDRVYDLVAALRSYLPGVEPYCLRFPGICEETTSGWPGWSAEM